MTQLFSRNLYQTTSDCASERTSISRSKLGRPCLCSGRSNKRPKCSMAAPSNAVERLSILDIEIENAINDRLGSCLTETSWEKGRRFMGKVRDTYDLGDKLLIITTDRQSAFDRHLASVPFKGQVLNQTSAWWMSQTSHIVPNALISVPDPNASLMHKCRVFPVEFVVRGFLTGSTETSLWTHYNAGEREHCGNTFPDGMKKNDRLEHNIITPTTKAADHDVPISPQDIVARGLMTQQEWDQIIPKMGKGTSYMQARNAALALFSFGQQVTEERGLLLVDTKYEFGINAEGELVLIDEIHTPDSSRYWISETYSVRHAKGQEPQSIDKEFLRLWFRKHCDPYRDEVLPPAPSDLVAELSRRYITLYEKITEQKFVPADPSLPPNKRLEKNLEAIVL